MPIRGALPAALLLVACASAATHADAPCTDYLPWDMRFARTGIPDDPDDLAYAGDHLFAACGAGGLRIFAESSPGQWHEVSQTPVPGPALGVAAAGTLAVVAAGELVVFDVADPSAPLVLAAVPIGGWCVRLVGGFAVVGRDQPGLVSVVDLRIPSAPAVTDIVVPALDGTAAPGLPNDLEIIDGVAAFGFDRGVFLLDVSDPENPAPLGDAIVSDRVRDVSGRDGVLYLAAESAGLVILDATDPLDPVEIARHEGGYAGAVLVVDETVVLSGLRFIDVSDPHTPTLRRTRDMSLPLSFLEIRPGVICAGLHVTSAPPGGGELVTFDVPSEPNPTLEPPLPFPLNRQVATDGQRLATFQNGNFELWNVGQPTEPFLLGLVSAGSGYGVQFHGVDLEGEVAVGIGTYAGIYDTEEYLEVFDVSDPQTPRSNGYRPGVVVGSLGVRLHGGIAHLVDSDRIDRYAMPSLSYMGALSGVMSWFGEMDFAGDFLFVTGEGLEVFDLPAGTSVHLPLPEFYTGGLCLGTSTAFVTGGSFLYAIDIQDPHAPVLVGSLDLSPWRFGTSFGSPTLIGDHVYLALDSTVQVIDVSDPTDPRRITEFPWSGSLYGLTSYGNWIVGLGSGLRALPQCGGTATAASPAQAPSRFLIVSPNPFRDRVAIDLAAGVPTDGPARLEVFDIRGRHVRALTWLGNGASRVAWDGRDGAGRPVAAGVYFIRAARGDEAMTRAVVRLR